MTPNVITNAEADTLAFAVRYALTRPDTTASLTVVGEVVRLWDRLQYWHRKQLHSEIQANTERRQIWQRVLSLEVGPAA